MKSLLLFTSFIFFLNAQSKIAFNYNREIHIMNSDGSGMKQITDYKVPGHIPVSKNPQWSKDNKKLLFIYDPEWHGGMSLYIMNADGSNDIRLTSKPSSKDNATWSPAFSPDGKYGLFVSKRGANYEIYRLTIKNKKIINLTNTAVDEDNPSYAPDGKTIVFINDEYLMKMNADGSDQKKLSKGKFGMTSISKDGKFIAYVRIDSKRKGSLYYADRYGKNEKKIADDVVRWSSISWSPDGKRLVFNDTNHFLNTIRIDGSDRKKLRKGYDPSWSY